MRGEERRIFTTEDTEVHGGEEGKKLGIRNWELGVKREELTRRRGVAEGAEGKREKKEELRKRN